MLWFATEDIETLFHHKTQLPERIKNCTAVLCYNDKIASNMLDFLAKTDITVPQDLSVIGIDNSLIAERYKQSNVEALQTALQIYHPIK